MTIKRGLPKFDEKDTITKSQLEKERKEAEIARIKAHGIAIFDENKKSQAVVIEGFGSVAVFPVRSDGKVVNVLATIAYDFSKGYAISGNYFEVTILEHAPGAYYGIGLGSETFDVDGMMSAYQHYYPP